MFQDKSILNSCLLKVYTIYIYIEDHNKLYATCMCIRVHSRAAVGCFTAQLQEDLVVALQQVPELSHLHLNFMWARYMKIKVPGPLHHTTWQAVVMNFSIRQPTWNKMYKPFISTK